ncbi:MAG: DsbA family protein [Flavobacteriales bacterium]
MPPIRPFAFLLLTLNACAQTPEHTMNTNADHPMLCDPDSGLCTIPGAPANEATDAATAVRPAQGITIQYFTDPICSSCWGIEPQLRRLKAEYGSAVHVEYHMGGLLPGWDGFNGGGITKPGDVASHWDEASHHYHMPIIGDVWLEDPLASSYPPSIAFKAAELQDPARALAFLRRLREMVFLEKRNIARWDVIAEAATQTGLDTARLKQDMEGAGKALFQADLALARAAGVRGFPTMIVTNNEGERQVLYGSRPYAHMVATIQQLAPTTTGAALPSTAGELFGLYPTWCAQEAAVMLGVEQAAAVAGLDALVASGQVERSDTRNGAIWRKR